MELKLCDLEILNEHIDKGIKPIIEKDNVFYAHCKMKFSCSTLGALICNFETEEITIVKALGIFIFEIYREDKKYISISCPINNIEFYVGDDSLYISVKTGYEDYKYDYYQIKFENFDEIKDSLKNCKPCDDKIIEMFKCENGEITEENNE